MSKLHLGIITDIQYSHLPCTTHIERQTTTVLDKVRVAVKELNAKPLDATLLLGDFIDRDYRDFSTVFKEVNKLTSPQLRVLGNHDYCDADNYEYGNTTEAEQNVMGGDASYYTKDIGEWRFIMLNTNQLGIIETKPDTPERSQGLTYLETLKKEGVVNANGWNGGIDNTQMEWLRQQLDLARHENKPVIVCGHHQIYPGHRDSALNREAILELLANDTNVKAYLNGHNHDGDYGSYKDLHCVTFEAILDHPDKTAYGWIDLSLKQLTIHGVGRLTSRKLVLR